jgi:hypothetical protein
MHAGSLGGLNAATEEANDELRLAGLSPLPPKRDDFVQAPPCGVHHGGRQDNLHPGMRALLRAPLSLSVTDR